MGRFNVAVVLMMVLPLLICCYLVTVKVLSFDAFVGMNGFYFLLAVIFAVLGLLVGRQVLQDLLRQLVEANRQLATFNQRQAEFVNHVAHELRAPLTVVKGALDNLADGLHGSMTPDQLQPVRMSLQETDRMKRLANDLLDLARIEAGRVHLERRELHLQELLQGLAATYRPLCAQRGLGLTVELPPEPVRVWGDRDRLSQVLINLLTNAMKFTNAGGITLELRSEGDAVEIEISDTGSGIPAGDLERIFEKFERVESDDRSGAGLGLPIARALTQQHGGRLWATSELGKGSQFHLRLPIGQPTIPGPS